MFIRTAAVQIISTRVPDVFVIEPQVFGDERGFFFESFNQQKFTDETGLNPQFVQDNHSRSRQNILRGLHYQVEQIQGKLVRVAQGEVYDVAVDLRADASTFGQWAGVILSEENKRQLWIPPGFAHGFYVLSESADVLYKATDYYAPQHERRILWNDPDLGIEWPLLAPSPVLSGKDQNGVSFKAADVFK